MMGNNEFTLPGLIRLYTDTYLKHPNITYIYAKMHTALSLSLSSAMIHITSQSANWVILDLVLYSIAPVSGGLIYNTDNKLICKTSQADQMYK